MDEGGAAKIYLTMHALADGNGLVHASHAELAGLLLTEAPDDQTDDRLSRGIRDRIQECVRSGLVEVIPEPGRMNAYRVLPIESPQYWLPSSLWWRGWLRHFDGAALAIYLHIVSSLSERPKRSGPPRIPRRYVRFDDIRTATVLTYPHDRERLELLETSRARVRDHAQPHSLDPIGRPRFIGASAGSLPYTRT